MLEYEEEWQMLHTVLKEDLKKEIHLTRELLSNMHQEEVSLMLHDQGSLNLVLQQRSHIVERLSCLRSHRTEVTGKIQKIASTGNKQPSLEEMLPPHEETSTEILSLSDQLMALTERMNRQHHQIKYIAEQGDYGVYLSLQPIADARPKKKASVATYQIKK